ncbi:MAG TPA: DNA-formamidopyrimidine glycosylase [Syntrophomonadaceae bacterium]|nr:DNA-formamidopyrimidine glycosylase [Syntrophomonadaceae bacterium]
MPELPEVETILRTLKPKVLGRTIERVEVLLNKVIREPDAEQFVKDTSGRALIGVERRGKYLLFKLTGSLVMVVHLRMTGRLLYVAPDLPRDQYTHVVFYLDNGKELRFHDMRRFGTIDLIPAGRLKTFHSLNKLGPDALDPSLTRDVFKKRLKGRTGQIKKILLDQTFITGIGNIYANEILWKARIHPERSAASLTPRDLGRLYHAMREVLMTAIDHRGTTIRDYVDGEGKPGSFQELLAVHGRENQPCPLCGNSIVRVKNGGRSAYFCPSCQK